MEETLYKKVLKIKIHLHERQNLFQGGSLKAHTK